MSCTIPDQAVAETIAFHGHSCPGLAIGIRAAEFVRREFADVAAEHLLCVTETDMCAVDAIQYLTGCTFGKGNLIHRDYGKAAFSFFDLATGRAFRLVLRDDVRGEKREGSTASTGESKAGEPAGQEKGRPAGARDSLRQRLMNLPLSEVFACTELQCRPPRSARILQSLTCEACGEQTMESRTRRYGGRIFCIPCFAEVDQKM